MLQDPECRPHLVEVMEAPLFSSIPQHPTYIQRGLQSLVRYIVPSLQEDDTELDSNDRDVMYDRWLQRDGRGLVGAKEGHSTAKVSSQLSIYLLHIYISTLSINLSTYLSIYL